MEELKVIMSLRIKLGKTTKAMIPKPEDLHEIWEIFDGDRRFLAITVIIDTEIRAVADATAFFITPNKKSC